MGQSTTLLNIQGWVERIALRAFKKRVACPQGHSETQQRIDNVGFRLSTQPTPANAIF